jgi:mono/diheme cytochrome c family protein
MSKAKKILLLSFLFLILVSACATVAPTTAGQPTSTSQSETMPAQVEPASTLAADPTTAAPAPVQPPAAAPADPSIAASEAQALLDGRCKRCHSLQKVTSFKGDFAAWESIVTNMINRGANLSEEEKAILVQFLAENYK